MSRFFRKGLAGLAVICLIGAPGPGLAGLGDILEGVGEMFSGGQGLDDADIAAGLKEALQVGTAQAVAKTGRVGGYFNNPEIKIPLPGPLAKSEKVLRYAGYGDQVDAFSQSINLAAEKAAPLAGDLFGQAIREITIADARRIWKGGDTAATDYFREKTGDRLRESFSPIVHDSLAQVGATRKFQDLDNTLQSLPFGESLALDLDGYVTEGALQGLFTMLAAEEKKIRQDPTARTTELLRKVFGSGE